MPMISSRTRRPGAATPILLDADPPRLERLATHRHKQPQDTELGCRAFAAADLLQAGALTGAYPRARMEHSAATWTARAELLHRVEAGASAARLKAAQA
jgi:hypothetical protein